MSPELAARVRASVRGSKHRPTRVPPALVGAARAAAVVAAVAVVLWGVRVGAHRADAREAARTELLELAQRNAERVDREGRALPERVATIVSRNAGAYEGDLVADSLRSPDVLAAQLSRPMVYLRGTLATLAAAGGVAKAAEESSRDAFATCFVDPPAERTERALRRRAHAPLAPDGGPKIERLHVALAGLPFLTSEWAARIRRADSIDELGQLRAWLERAPLDAAVRALNAPVFLLVIDEEKVGSAPSELDGTHAHWARVVWMDLASDAPLARLRRLIDPAGLSDDGRVAHAAAITSCALACEARDAMRPLPGKDGARGPRAPAP